MLKKTLCALALFVFSQAALAQKIVIVDFQQAMFETEYAKAKLQQFTSAPEIAKLKAEFDSLNADLEILSKEMQSKSMTWGEEEKAAHRKKMEDTYRNAQAKQQQWEGQQKQVMQGIIKHFQPQVESVVKKYVEENSIDFILRREAVAYNSSADYDVTKAITAELNKLEK